MLLRIEMVGAVALLTLMDNKLDASNQEEFNREVDPVLAQTSKIVLDLHLVEFVDSSGCNSLLRTVSKLRPSGQVLTLCASRTRVRETFNLVGLHRTCELYETVAEGLKSFGETGERPAPG